MLSYFLGFLLIPLANIKKISRPKKYLFESEPQTIGLAYVARKYQSTPLPCGHTFYLYTTGIFSLARLKAPFNKRFSLARLKAPFNKRFSFTRLKAPFKKRFSLGRLKAPLNKRFSSGRLKAPFYKRFSHARLKALFYKCFSLARLKLRRLFKTAEVFNLNYFFYTSSVSITAVKITM